MEDFTAEILEALEKQESIVMATVIGVRGEYTTSLGRKMVVKATGEARGSLGSFWLDARVREDCIAAIREGRSRSFCYDGGTKEAIGPASMKREGVDVFIELLEGAPELLIFGAGHVGQALYRVAKILGFRVVVVDDRATFANRERYPEADEILCGVFAEVMANHPITLNTYIVAVTRGHKMDEVSLRLVANSLARYIGMIGSKRRVSTVLAHMARDGFSQEVLRRIYTPIGLDIGAETPEEIAVSIMAEIIKVRRGGTGHSMALKEQEIAR